VHSNPTFLAVCLNPTLQKTLVFTAVRAGDVNRCLRSRLDASGKGVNVARVLGELGQRATHLTHAGGRFRSTFIALAEASGVTVRAVDSKSQIRFCTTLVELETANSTELVETSERVSETTEARLRRAYHELIKTHDFVIISGTKAAGYSEQLIPDLVVAARAQGCRIVLDVHGADLVNSLASKPDVVKPNFSEFLATYEPLLTGSKPSDPDAVEKVEAEITRLSAETGVAFVITRGPRATLVAEKGHVWQQAPGRHDVVNPIGSGDAFAAGLACALGRGKSLRDAVAEGNRCGLLNAQQLAPGTLGATVHSPPKNDQA
jgi:1-phosphofructokinase/tagatose 6-phosphate kinase